MTVGETLERRMKSLSYILNLYLNDLEARTTKQPHLRGSNNNPNATSSVTNHDTIAFKPGDFRTQILNTFLILGIEPQPGYNNWQAVSDVTRNWRLYRQEAPEDFNDPSSIVVGDWITIQR